MLQRYTVISFTEDTGQIFSDHVVALNRINAFASAAAIDPTRTMVVALDGWLNEGNGVEFPGEGLVDAGSVNEQPEVFGVPPFPVNSAAIEAVLRSNALQVANSRGMTFGAMAEAIFDDFDTGRVAMASVGLEEQAQAIKMILVETGVLKK